MDEMTMVRDLLAERAAPSDAVTEHARKRLETRMRGQVRPFRRRHIGPVVAGIAAAGAAAAITLAFVAPAGSHPAAPAVAGPHPALTGQPARAFLLAVSARAAQGPATGRYWCETEAQGSRELIVTGDKEVAPPWLTGKTRYPAAAPAGYQYALLSRVAATNCLALPHGDWRGGTVAASDQNLGSRPASPADTAAWRRHGSPSHWKTWFSGQISSGHSGPVTWSGPIESEPGDGWGVKLPASPAKLKALLLRDISRPKKRPANIFGYTIGGGTSPDKQLYMVTESLLNDPVSAAVRSAAFHVLAGIPDVRMRPGVTDPEGQTGTAVWLGKPGAVPAAFSLIDPATGRLMGDMNVARTRVDGAPAGTILTYTAFTSAQWTSHLPVPAGDITPAMRRAIRG